MCLMRVLPCLKERILSYLKDLSLFISSEAEESPALMLNITKTFYEKTKMIC